MPIYEYQCTACGHHLEALQKISADPLKECPVCKEPALSKQVSASAFRLGGTGWYETDFKSGNKKNLAGDAGKTDTKPDSTQKDASAKESKPKAEPGKPSTQAAS